MRDGVSHSSATKIRPVFSATDIQNLEKNEGFLKRPGRFPIAKIKLNYLNPPERAKGFIEKELVATPSPKGDCVGIPAVLAQRG